MLKIFSPTDADKLLILLGLESMHISKCKYYAFDGERVNLENEQHRDFSQAIPYSPQALEELKICGTWANNAYASQHCNIQVVNSDSFEAVAKLKARTLVMNFANGHQPGGGFLFGAAAQEESLCRASTLYESLTSSEGQKMYEYNARNPSPVDSDYMILSPEVAVFRDRDGELIEQPFYTSVISVTAPDRAVAAKAVPPAELDMVINKRLENMLTVAVNHGFRALVLGAWGCGSFECDPWDVAKAFRNQLIGKGLSKYFDDIIFAIYNSPHNEAVFQEVLANT